MRVTVRSSTAELAATSSAAVDTNTHHRREQGVPENARASDPVRDCRQARMLLVHGSPRRLNEYLFEDRPLFSFQRLARSSAQCRCHRLRDTHVPYTNSSSTACCSSTRVRSANRRTGIPRACYALLDMSSEPSVVFRRVPFTRWPPRPMPSARADYQTNSHSIWSTGARRPRPGRNEESRLCGLPLHLHAAPGRDRRRARRRYRAGSLFSRHGTNPAL